MVNDYLTVRSHHTVSSNTPTPLEHLSRYSSAAHKKTQLRGMWGSDRHMSDRCCNVGVRVKYGHGIMRMEECTHGSHPAA
jgi:hypothetical protein